MSQVTCHDCKNAIEETGSRATYMVGHDTYHKCAPCHETDSVLRNFRKTEVYSRVVGYIRPVEQWNNGKQAEYADRMEFVAA